MKLLAGCVVSAGLLVVAWSANAQMLAPQMLGSDGAGRSPSYQAVSDFEEPYGGMPSGRKPFSRNTA